MGKKIDRKQLSEALQPIAEKLGYQFLGLEIEYLAGQATLRVYIDTPGGVLLDDCEKVSQDVSQWLDQHADEFDDNYFLEVSSPGIERPLFTLQDYARFIGQPVSVKLKELFEGRHRITAVIAGTRDDTVLLDSDTGPVDIPFDGIQSGHIVYIEQKGQKKTFKTK